MMLLLGMGLVAGLIAGYFLGRPKTTGIMILIMAFLGFLGVFAAAALFNSVITKLIVRRVCGVTDTRVLK